MADTKISNLTAATDLVGASILVVQGGMTKKASASLLSGPVVDAALNGVATGVASDQSTALNAVIASIDAGVVMLPRGQIRIDSTILRKNNVLIVGQGHGTIHADGSNSGHATEILWYGSVGGTMVALAPTEGAAALACTAGGIIGVALNGRSIAAKGLHTKGCHGNDIDVYVCGCTGDHVLLDVATTLADSPNTHHNRINIEGSAVGATDGILLRLTGNAGLSNACYNKIDIRGLYKDSDGLVLGNSDNNIFGKVWLYRFGGGTGKGVRLKATTDAYSARANLFVSLYPGDGGVTAEGTDTSTVASYDNRILAYDKDNSAPDPVIGTGATLSWGTTNRIFASQSGGHSIGFGNTYAAAVAALAVAISGGSAVTIQDTNNRGIRFISSADTTKSWQIGYNPANNALRVNSPSGETAGLDVLGSFLQNGATVIDGSAGIRFPVYAATAIAAVGNAVNISNKVAGKAVWDSTNHRIMVANGPAAADLWYVADGSASVTPV